LAEAGAPETADTATPKFELEIAEAAVSNSHASAIFFISGQVTAVNEHESSVRS
jgi:hypothetical protein